ncbi:hypothetical protein [Rhodococcus jostii]|uniref:hypothetical protein n=1 Tax=Rhodococcus jostii TaxID=132919 RepID=UPI003630D2F2
MIPEPKWTGDHREWQAVIAGYGRIPPVEISDRARAVATTVFYIAADYNTMYRAPLQAQIDSWGAIFDCSASECRHWLTVDLAGAAVTAHLSQSIDGRMLPFHVLREATFIRLERTGGGDI